VMSSIGQFLTAFTSFLGVYFMFSRFNSVNGKIKLPGFGKENAPPIHKLLLVD
jgi:hypothetical protein